ncbi:MAG: hydroxyacid dehydrogenase, partial [Nitrospinaceae bacterium]|nr:hydroxyacid dehydrogenase [Nitrospinaceae bacterium]NIR55915.1 hydroxyacid dehydrogenase [Nitrospinaceae bacterium]NIS86362.1 hydroxyacid dehydrogenase [Nitrospinaceae bacterium]NIT83198.1 hydroxyacid dehydrogenase [Nitrospinaceae bacterium]NIU45409.1 hydroxyacid dehydrogenase [Nitrospinaceae bacterium]
MSHAFPRLAVTPPAFCRSKILRTELTRFFPHSTFNTKDRYLSEDELIDFLQEAQGALIGRDPVTERVLRAHPQLRVISKYGVGLDNIDPEAL